MIILSVLQTTSSSVGSGIQYTALQNKLHKKAGSGCKQMQTTTDKNSQINFVTESLGERMGCMSMSFF